MCKTQRKTLLSAPSAECCIFHKASEVSNRVYHHCHVTGTIFGVSHSSCNLRAQTTKILPIFFHNLSRYDSHQILKNLRLLAGEKLPAFAKTDETFTSFSIAVPLGSYKDKRNKIVTLRHSLRFLDSLQFMSQSLDSLAKTVQLKDFVLLRRHFFHVTDDLFQKLTKKGHFPYIFLYSLPKFDVALSPFGDAWRKSLTGSIDFTSEDYDEPVSIYNAFSCQNSGDYRDLYLETDVFLLADIFEKFRKVCMNVYKLDPSHFYSAPNLSWGAMLLSTEGKLGLLDDTDKLLFFERSIRGGFNGVGEVR